jgi:hypothetical protein
MEMRAYLHKCLDECKHAPNMDGMTNFVEYCLRDYYQFHLTDDEFHKVRRECWKSEQKAIDNYLRTYYNKDSEESNGLSKKKNKHSAS